jgi:hypothetical protein
MLRSCLVFLIALAASAPAQTRNTITVSGTRFLLNGEHFPYTGVSFFNAIYNKQFNQSSGERKVWLEKFRKYGINVLRVWGQWDSRRGYADTCPECTLYFPDGRLREEHVERLRSILSDADSLGMVVELALFAQESWHAGIRLGEKESEKAAAAVAVALKPHRNLTIQIWNEFSWHTVEMIKAIKAVDPARLVSNSPGGAGVLTGPAPAETQLLDYLTPHTSRQRSGKPWEIGPAEIEYLLKRYRKPVVDDEPARNGTPDFGGPGEKTFPTDHILQIYKVWQLGAYVTYHHDMFQTGYGTPAVPPSGIPDPEFNPYHRAAFEFLANRARYAPAGHEF